MVVWSGRTKRLTWDERVAITRSLAVGMSKSRAADVAGVAVSSVDRVVAEAGGMPPRWRDRNPCRLSLAEREEISRGLAVGESMRALPARLGRSPSTASREVAGNNGARGYRAGRAGQRAFDKARRPKDAVLAINGELLTLVEQWLE